MTTIKIKPTHPSQGDFVIIEKADFDPSKHELLEGEHLADTGNAGDGVPTLAELLAGRDQLLARKDELDDRELQLSQRAGLLDERENALVERELANATESQRLADLSAAQAVAAGKPDFAAMTKDQLKAALTEKGVPFASTADKADLIALLTAA
nr:hypothetical protein [uncultured Duganella sp.]